MTRIMDPEESLLSTVLDALRRYGWRVMHQRPCRTERGWRTLVQGHPGFPDIVAVRGNDPDRGRGPGLLFVELKSENGSMTADQHRWASDLTDVEDALADPIVTYHLVRPSDLDAFIAKLR